MYKVMRDEIGETCSTNWIEEEFKNVLLGKTKRDN
jgi:hypothetical protein